MNVQKQLTKNLANAADVLGTISGGVVHPTFEAKKLEDHYRIEINIPSIDPVNINVEVKNRSLFIIYHLQFNDYKIPNVIGVFNLLGDVILEDIAAEYVDEKLVIILPFYEILEGLNRKIDILKR